MSLPVQLVAKYEDGSTREVNFESVDGETRYRLARLGLCPAGDYVDASKHYLLLRWQDGWQEVVGVDKASADLLRYYVIERIEDRGRLSLEVGGDYPELFVIERTPRELIGAMIVGAGGVKSYGLDAAVERWEGIFEAGGKREYVKYDKTSSDYPQRSSDKAEALDPVLDALRSELDKKGLDAKALLAMDEAQRVAEYKALASGANIRGSNRQEDVYGFIELMMTKLAGASR